MSLVTSAATNTRESVEIRTAHEVVAARAAELALLVVQFMAAARAPTPVFARNLGGVDGTGWVLDWSRELVFRRHVWRASDYDAMIPNSQS